MECDRILYEGKGILVGYNEKQQLYFLTAEGAHHKSAEAYKRSVARALEVTHMAITGREDTTTGTIFFLEETAK